jgi:hypothetical protein
MSTETAVLESKAMPFPGFEGFASTDPTFGPYAKQIQNCISQLAANEKVSAQLQVDAGHFLFDRKKVWQDDDRKYSVIRKTANQTEPEELSRYEAELEALGLHRQKANGFVNRYKENLKKTNPVPASLIQATMATKITDILTKTDPTNKDAVPTLTETATEALADAYLAAGQPSQPTERQSFLIVADAVKRAESVPIDDLEEFGKRVKRAMDYAEEKKLTPEAIAKVIASKFDANTWRVSVSVSDDSTPKVGVMAIGTQPVPQSEADLALGLLQPKDETTTTKTKKGQK